FDPAHVLRFSINLPESRYTSAQVVDFYRQFESDLTSVAGVTAAGIMTNNPASNVPNPRAQFSIAGREPQRASETPLAERQIVNPSIFSVLKTPLVEGRLFNASDGADTPRVALVSHGFAQQFWPKESPIAGRIKFAPADPDAPWITIVGVVSD